MSEKRLENKVAWVTGSSRGIGRVIAAHLAGMGASVVVHGTTPYSTRSFGEADSLEEVAQSIAAEHHVAVMPVYGDLSDEATVKAIVAQIHQRFGRIDILVNCAGGDIGVQGVAGPNAGKPPANDAINISLADIRSVLDRNLMTCILVSREVAPEMMARREGWIVNIGSDAGLWGIATSAIYATAKAAVHEYTRCLSAFLREHNVRVNAVAPGGIVTPRFLASRPIDESRRVKDGTLDRYGWPDEIARVVAFLVTDDSSFVNGQVLRVDAGRQLFPA
jgi:3-oxoacyl-[acyl-carrier protein] reductase